MEKAVNIQVTDIAREKLSRAFSESDFLKPALRIMFAGFG